jgi:hypothetical protein
LSSPTSIRFPDLLRLRVEGVAEEEKRTFSQAVLILLEEALRGRGAVGPGADPPGQSSPRPPSDSRAPLDEAAGGVPHSTPEPAASSSGGNVPTRTTHRRSKVAGAEPVASGPLVGASSDSPSRKSAPVKKRRPRSGKCEHMVPAGTFCKKCGE